MIRVCPKRDAICPHGMGCPYTVDRYHCAPEPKEPSPPSSSPLDPVAMEALEAKALAEFTDYFVQNYPGPNTIIGNPNWHAPKIFRAAQHALRALNATRPTETEDRAEKALRDIRSMADQAEIYATGRGTTGRMSRLDPGKQFAAISEIARSALVQSSPARRTYADGIEDAAKVCEPGNPRPPHDGGWLGLTVRQAYDLGLWDGRHSDAVAIRALPHEVSHD